MCKLKTILQGYVRKVITLSSRLTSHYTIRVWPFEVHQQTEASTTVAAWRKPVRNAAFIFYFGS